MCSEILKYILNVYTQILLFLNLKNQRKCLKSEKKNNIGCTSTSKSKIKVEYFKQFDDIFDDKPNIFLLALASSSKVLVNLNNRISISKVYGVTGLLRTVFNLVEPFFALMIIVHFSYSRVIFSLASQVI